MGDAYFTENGQIRFSQLFLVPSSVAFAAALPVPVLQAAGGAENAGNT
jgi:hypothetical protein